MGGTEKEVDRNIPVVVKNKQNVSEATISKLLNDFNSAALLKGSIKSSSNADSNAPSEKVGFEEISSSLKQLHLRKPADARQKMRERKGQARKGKASSGNKYNLSVAAVSVEKPVVWPGKLNNSSKKDYVCLLQPSRLLVGKKDVESNLLKSNVNTSSMEEKARIECELKKNNVPQFGSSSIESGKHHTSFSHLSEKHSKTDVQREKDVSNSKSNSSSVKRPNSCSIPAAKHPRLYNDIYVSSDIAQCLDYRCTANSYSNEDFIGGSCFTSPTKSITAPLKEHISSEESNRISSASHVEDEGLSASSLSSPLTSAGGACESSWSDEVGMEESNVNELSSYFNDMLHIPKKMSVMAEMMYG